MDDFQRLTHYKRTDIQQAMVDSAKGREVGVRYGNRFGARPDVLLTCADVSECAKQGATSFHLSEERWTNPLHLNAELPRGKLDDMRIGWDLVIDVDCPVWEYSKLIAHHVILVLKEHGVKSISCKFSGNKGFHIGVPFEAFPSKDASALFPDGVRIIASYIVSQIDKGGRFTDIVLKEGIDTLSKKVDIPLDQLYYSACTSCGEKQSNQVQKIEYVCDCGHREILSHDVMVKVCPKCKKIMEKHGASIIRCRKCKGTTFEEKFDLELLLSIDAILISSRHLYRMVYSLHEKSGLMSIPINPDKVLQFNKELADPTLGKFSRFTFLDSTAVTEPDATNLLNSAFEWHTKTVKEKELYTKTVEKKNSSAASFEITQKLPDDFFPPCMKLLLEGIRDGRKRGIFMLINFLHTCGYNYDEIEKKLKEWNERNPEPIREVYIRGQLHAHKSHQKKVLPPNCTNDMYMKGMGLCKPDGFCSRIKNPAQYAKKRAWMAAQDEKKKPGPKKKTSEKKSDSKKKN